MQQAHTESDNEDEPEINHDDNHTKSKSRINIKNPLHNVFQGSGKTKGGGQRYERVSLDSSSHQLDVSSMRGTEDEDNDDDDDDSIDNDDSIEETNISGCDKPQKTLTLELVEIQTNITNENNMVVVDSADSASAPRLESAADTEV